MTSVLTTARTILGMNARNLRFIRPYNSSRAVKLANDKLATKQRLHEHHLPTAELYGVIRNRKELFTFDWTTLPSSFVIKPNFGLGGGGIILIYGKTKTGRWISNDNETYTTPDLLRHVSNILDGNFSMSNIPDIAYFEQRLKLSEHFKHVSYQGIPDVRIIVFNSVPVMAMLRLPTTASHGKANLHIGGLGVGINLTTGMTTFATSKLLGEITHHPDFNTALRGIQIPDWDNLLLLSIAAQQAIGLGYAGVDIVIDKLLGPVILEVNGHPGLEIQNANHLALQGRLRRIQDLHITSATKGLKVCKELFGDATSAATLDWPILDVYESVVVLDLLGQPHTLRARLDTGLQSTTMTKDLAKSLGFKDALAALDTLQLPASIAAADAQQAEAAFRQAIVGLHPAVVDIVAVRSGGQYIIRPKVSLTFTLHGKTITTQVSLALDNKLSHPLIIGRHDLRGFLINPANAMIEV